MGRERIRLVVAGSGASGHSLEEGVEIIRALWAGETVTRHGRIPTEEARLYSRPVEPPLVVAAALSPETAR